MTPSHVEVNRCAGGCNHRQQSCLPTRVRKKKIPVSQCTNENTQPSYAPLLLFFGPSLIFFLLLFTYGYQLKISSFSSSSGYESRDFFSSSLKWPLRHLFYNVQTQNNVPFLKRGEKRSCQPYSRGLERLSFHFEKNDVRAWCSKQ